MLLGDYMGTLINFIGIIIGSIIGLLLNKKISQNLGATVLKLLAFVIFVVGLAGTLRILFLETENLVLNYSLVLLISIVFGGALGEVLKIDDYLNKLANVLEKKYSTSNFSKGFITASLLFVVGAMAITGPLADALSGDITILLLKSFLDFISSILLSATLGIGVLFSAIPVLLYQGAIYLAAMLFTPNLDPQTLNQIYLVGYAIVSLAGLNILKVVEIKLGNLIPALIVPLIYTFIVSLF
jgi:uncharacterized membrane protein YqgA involved in biofilm formation